MTGRIIILDDSAIVRDTLDTSLAHEGYAIQTARDGQALRRLLAEAPADLVILDIQGTGDDGLALTRALRATQSCGIIALTAGPESAQRIAALESGADDTLCKPHEPRELLARVRSILRRVASPVAGLDGPGEVWRLDAGTRAVVSRCGRRVALTGAEFKLLDLLTQRPGQALSRDILLQAVYGRAWSYFDRSIDVLVTRLRRKLEATTPGFDQIRSVRGTGYLFCPTPPGRAA